MIATRMTFGPTDHGRPVTAEELDLADYQEGYRYEVIDGSIYVSPVPNPLEHRLTRWLRRKLEAYADGHAEVVGWVAVGGKVVLTDSPKTTRPEPDIALFKDNLEDLDVTSWSEVSPVIVVEVLVEADPEKDLVRNVDLYLRVPSIVEYWILDGRDDPKRPRLHVRRRSGKRWLLTEVAYGETYATAALPGFELLLDPKK